ncbi:MAG: hypothetical protein HY308_04250, partial [Gammaproteobacteria bacterium]|nr:hypothetical protein [Gammaproteobacteria bacterium]
MDNKIGGKTCIPQPVYVIVEQIYSKNGWPDLFNTISPSHNQVFRKVMQVCDYVDTYFEDQLVHGEPSVWQMIQEAVLPGTRLTARPTGEKGLSVPYMGFRNFIQPLPQLSDKLPKALTKEYKFDPPTPYTFGVDPIPSIQLYGNPNVELFYMVGGKSPATAAAVYFEKTQ